jgi:hypothetical protein
LNSCWDACKERKQGNQGLDVRIIQNQSSPRQTTIIFHSTTTTTYSYSYEKKESTDRIGSLHRYRGFFLVKQTIIFRIRIQIMIIVQKYPIGMNDSLLFWIQTR